MAQLPFLSVVRVVPPPREGQSSLTDAPAIALLSAASVTLPNSRPMPFQSWA